jgi:hypothetical protein
MAPTSIRYKAYKLICCMQYCVMITYMHPSLSPLVAFLSCCAAAASALGCIPAHMYTKSGTLIIYLAARNIRNTVNTLNVVCSQ